MREDFKVFSFNTKQGWLTGVNADYADREYVQIVDDKIAMTKMGCLIPYLTHPSMSEVKPGEICFAYLMDFVPQIAHIKGATYKGKTVTEVSLDYKKGYPKYATVNGFTVGIFPVELKVEGYKRVVRTNFNPGDYIFYCAILSGDKYREQERLCLRKEPISMSIYSSGFADMRTAGGGYAEAYYVTTVNLNARKFCDYYICSMLTDECIYYLIDERALQELRNTSNWEVEVDDDRYDGWYVSGFSFYPQAKERLDKILSENIASYKGRIKMNFLEMSRLLKTVPKRKNEPFIQRYNF